MRFIVRDREAGNKIDEAYTYEEAVNKLHEFESVDKKNGEYSQDFYEVAVELFYGNGFVTRSIYDFNEDSLHDLDYLKSLAAEEAKEYQSSFANNTYSYSDMAEFGHYFTKLGELYGLNEEFTENGII